MVHSVRVNGRSSHRFTVHDDDTITIDAPEELFSANADRVAQLITMGMRVDPTMKVMFYGDIAPNINRSLADVCNIARFQPPLFVLLKPTPTRKTVSRSMKRCQRIPSGTLTRCWRR
mmetsp:Transcript_31165/g.61020  ORF Transcript_31165/g.61020 Transcript_31165/m.61020 type:complete len:117 (-) Transcript_31165:259-609(-)